VSFNDQKHGLSVSNARSRHCSVSLWGKNAGGKCTTEAIVVTIPFIKKYQKPKRMGLGSLVIGCLLLTWTVDTVEARSGWARRLLSEGNTTQGYFSVNIGSTAGDRVTNEPMTLFVADFGRPITSRNPLSLFTITGSGRVDVLYSKELGKLYVLASVYDSTEPGNMEFIVPEGATTDEQGAINEKASEISSFAPENGYPIYGYVIGWTMFGAAVLSIGATIPTPKFAIALGAINFIGFVQIMYMIGNLQLANMPWNYREAAEALDWIGLNPSIGPINTDYSLGSQAEVYAILADLNVRFPRAPVTIRATAQGQEFPSESTNITDLDAIVSLPIVSVNDSVSIQDTNVTIVTVEEIPVEQDVVSGEPPVNPFQSPSPGTVNSPSPSSPLGPNPSPEENNDNTSDKSPNQSPSNEQTPVPPKDQKTPPAIPVPSPPMQKPQDTSPEYQEPSPEPSSPSIENQYISPSPPPPYEKPVPSPPNEKPVPSPPNEKPVPSPPYEKPVPSPPYEKPVPSPPYEKPVPSPPNEKPVPSPPNEKPVPSPPYEKPVLSPPYEKPVPSPPYEKPVPSPPYEKPVPSPPYEKPVPSPPYEKPVPSPPYQKPSPSPIFQKPSPSPSIVFSPKPSPSPKLPTIDPVIIKPSPIQIVALEKSPSPLPTVKPSPSMTVKPPVMGFNVFGSTNQRRKLLIVDPVNALGSSGFSYTVVTATPDEFAANTTNIIEEETIGSSILSRIRAIEDAGNVPDADQRRLNVLWNVLFWSAICLLATFLIHGSILLFLRYRKADSIPKMLYPPRIELVIFMIVLPMICAAGCACLQSTSTGVLAAGVCFGVILPFGFLLGASAFIIFAIIRPSIQKRRALYVVCEAYTTAMFLPHSAGDASGSPSPDETRQVSIAPSPDFHIVRGDDSSASEGSKDQDICERNVLFRVYRFLYASLLSPAFGFASPRRANVRYESVDASHPVWLGHDKKDAVLIKRFGCFFEDAHGPQVFRVSTNLGSPEKDDTGGKDAFFITAQHSETVVEICQTFGVLLALTKLLLFAAIINAAGGVNNVAQVIMLLVISVIHIFYLRFFVPYRLRIELAAEIVAALCDLAVFICGIILISKSVWTTTEGTNMGIAMLVLQAVGFLVFITVRVGLALRTMSLTILSKR